MKSEGSWAKIRKIVFAVVGLITFLLGYSARAMLPGTPGGSTRTGLTYAGNISPFSTGSKPMLQFHLAKGGATCVPPQVQAAPDSNGNFVVEIDIDQCLKSGFVFDGADVTYTIDVDGVTGTSPATVDPVPYAKYADRVAGPRLGTYCGSTAKTSAKFQATCSGQPCSGLDASKVLCENVARCGLGSGAHICTGEEALHSYLDGTLPRASGSRGWVIASGPSISGNSNTEICNGFTEDTFGTGSVYDGFYGSPDLNGCSGVQEIFCCK